MYNDTREPDPFFIGPVPSTAVFLIYSGNGLLRDGLFYAEEWKTTYTRQPCLKSILARAFRYDHAFLGVIMKLNPKLKDKRWAHLAIPLCIAILFYLVCSHLPFLGKGVGKFFQLMTPIFIGLVIGYVLNPVANFFHRTLFRRVKSYQMGRNLSVFVTVVVVLAVIALFLIAMVPSLVSSTVTLVENLDDYMKVLQDALSQLQAWATSKNLDISWLTGSADSLMDGVSSYVSSHTGSLLDFSVTVGTRVFYGVISFIIAIYFLADKRNLKIGLKHFLQTINNEKHYHNISVFGHRCNKIMYQFIGFDLLDALIIGVSNSVFFLIAGLPYNILISLVVGVTNLAPTFGPIVGGAIGALILLLQKPVYAVYFLIFTCILQTIDGYVLKPKLFGGALNVPSLWVLIVLIAGGRLCGVWGILLAIPFAAITDFIYHDYLLPWLEKRRHLRDKKQAEEEEKRKRKEAAAAAADLADAGGVLVETAVKEGAAIKAKTAEKEAAEGAEAAAGMSADGKENPEEPSGKKP